jgi:hypothetical protein
MKRFGVIYLITNKINGKKYVGQTKRSVNRRWCAHKNNKSGLLSKAFKKYGLNNFIFEEIISCFDMDSLNFYEKYFIEYHKAIRPNGYNLTTGGNNYTFEESVKQKMRDRKINKESTNHIVAVKAINIDSKEEFIFNSFKEASNKLNISRSSILVSCKYKVVRRGYMFEYLTHANQSGSSKEIFEHAQRLEGETKNVNNPSTSPRFPKKYHVLSKEILELASMNKTPHAISKLLDLDKTMVGYFIHCFGK